MISTLKKLHWLGVLMLLTGMGMLWLTPLSQQLGAMVMIACLIGLGLVLMAPYPVLLLIDWAQKQDPAANAGSDKNDRP
ncbi:hypothetical protein [Ferrimonas pelagia]|uniref:Uncharacterized protein n=1 Tax=Ferrimonas pelagia TaxID=1177826 RepID=A0ABP9ENR9_9GAMM